MSGYAGGSAIEGGFAAAAATRLQVVAAARLAALHRMLITATAAGTACGAERPGNRGTAVPTTSPETLWERGRRYCKSVLDRLCSVVIERPADMFAHQLGGIIDARSQGGERFRGRWRITQRHRDVAQPALVADPADRRTLGVAQEVRLAPREQRDQPRRIEPVAYIEIRLRRRACEAVPRADQLAVIAAIDPVAHQCSQLHGD